MNYPGGCKKTNTLKDKKNIIYENRGVNLENDINESNQYYCEKKIAFIYKKPTPIKLVKVDYKNRKINEAYFDMPSTTDYNGIYKEKYIDFEAKETINIKGFPLINIHNHQIEHIRNIYHAHGICFLIIRFTKLNKTYLLFAKDFIEFLDNVKKSVIPIGYFEERAYIIKDTFVPRIDYLKIIDEVEDL